MLTLNQDIELLSQFAVKHKVINSFYFGAEAEADTDLNIVYPFMNAILQNQSSLNGIISRTYLIIISDLVQTDKSNLNHVLSDTERICWDIPLYMRQVSNSGLLGAFKVNPNITVTPDDSRNDDNVASSYFDLTISSPLGNDACNLPINSGNILVNTYIYVGGTYTQITNTMSIITETFTYASLPITLSHTPINILTAFADASVQFETADYTKSGSTITPTSPIVENGTILRYTYTY